MTATLDKNTSSGNRGSHYNKDSDYLYYVNEPLAQIWRQPVNPATMIVQQVAKALTSGLSQNLNVLGSGDLRWVGGTSKQVSAQNGSKVAKLTGFSAFDQIPPDALAGINWDSLTTNNTVAGEDGLSTAGNFYAVKIPVTGGDPHYTKVRIFKDKDGATKIEWITYIVGTRPSLIHTLDPSFPAPRDIFVNETESEIHLSGGVDDAGYVILLQRIVGDPFPQFSNNTIPLSDPSSGTRLTNPQQMVVDGDSIYVVAEDGLFLLQPQFSVQVPVVTGITAPVGLLLDKQKSSLTAYISNHAGQVYVVDISQFNPPAFDSSGTPFGGLSAPLLAPDPTPEFALGGPSGFLTWADDAHSAFYATVLGATGKVQRIDLLTASVANELTAVDPTLPDPWSIEVFSDSGLTIVCDAKIFDVERGVLLTGDLALGLGLIPFDFINNSKDNPALPAPTDGRANTSSAPGYYFSAYPNLAFGGTLSLLLNHPAAWNSGLRFYKLSITNDATGVSHPITNAFTDLLWNATAHPPRFESSPPPLKDGPFYPVRPPSELWFNPFLAGVFNTTLSDNGHNRLKIEFFKDKTQLIATSSFTRLIFIDNNRSSVSLTFLRRGTATLPPTAGAYQVPEVCGLSAYDTKDDLIEVDFTAVHPSGGKYAVTFYRGSTALFTSTGDLTTSPTMLTVKERSPGVPLRIGHLTGDCDIANISIYVSAPSPGVINGYGWVSLSSITSRTFTLAKPPLTHSTWPTALMANRPALMLGAPTAKK
jgi:hypothetical protein